MKHPEPTHLALLGALLLAACAEVQPDLGPPVAREAPAGSHLSAVFEGRTPCGDCERLKMALVLHREDGSDTPSFYALERLPVGEAPRRLQSQGRWSEVTGAAVDPAAKVVVLDENTPVEFRRYLAVGDNILLLLDDSGHPRVGDASHSYTLSRTE